MTETTEVHRGAPRRNSAGLRRDLELLEILARDEARTTPGGLGVVRIAELVGRDKGQVSRTLATLAEAGLVSRDPGTLGYSLGYQLYALAARTMEARLVREAAPFLRRLVTATHETTHLCVLRGGNVLTLSSELSEHHFRGLGWQGVSTAAWRTSSGRVLVSGWSDEELEEWYELHGRDESVIRSSPLAEDAALAPQPPAAPPGRLLVTDAASLLAEIHRIRERGYATVDEEFEAGVVGVSAPVHDAHGQIIAAINIAAPKGRLGGHLDEAGRLTARVARDLSARLAGRDPAAR
jgi:DNA-binding IclR family transcriptional regulator